MTQTPPSIAALRAAGQSLWLDQITRDMLDDGTLKDYVDRLGITGLTSNPTIFDEAIGHSSLYDETISARAADKIFKEDIFFGLAIEDLTRAAALLLPIFEASNHTDGFVSLEVSPTLADDTHGTIAEGLRLHKLANCPNLLIKVPGTAAGITAVEELVLAGVPVNVTLLFSTKQYLAAAEAYLRAIERRLTFGLDPRIASVASIFVSRWDKAVAQRVAPGLANKLGIAVGAATYAAYRGLLDSPRWQQLAEKGAVCQRVLFASTGAKDPALSAAYYVNALSAPGTINSMPEKTLHAFAKEGRIGEPLSASGAATDASLTQFAAAGIDLDGIAARLQIDAQNSFNKSWIHLMDTITEKSALNQPELVDSAQV